MEHLPLPTQPSLQTTPIFPTIPYLCKYEYDKGPFLDYPHRLGLPNLEVDDTFPFASLSIFHGRFLVAMSQAELEPFLQNWLFFGLLHEVLEDIYRHEDFVAVCLHMDGVQSNHASCDERTCRLEGSATSRQVPHHVSDSCGCKLLQVDEKLLADCLEKGCLPLLRIRGEHDIDDMQVEVIASTDSTCYVALSHVWADGLGNPKATALPRCQLSRVKALVNNLDFDYLPRTAASDHLENASEMLLWCDTLCCPVQSKEAQKMALMQMYRTYERASVVLVLDRGLISHREGRVSFIQACLRVATSRWMTRLWTLQEGALPAKKNKLWFQFTKTALPLWSLYNHLFEVSATDIQWRGIVSSIIARLNTFTHLFDIASIESQGAQLKDVLKGLLYRSVTVPSDEPLIIATLMALDLSRILACKPRKRMNVLWRMIATSPSGVDKDILFHTAPKLQRRGLRWAPRSLLFTNIFFARPVPGEPKNRAFLAKVGNTKGLVAELAGIRINMAKCANGLPKILAGFDSLPKYNNDRYRLLLKVRQGSWYHLKHGRDNTSDLLPDLEELYASISKLKNPWVLYRGTSSNTPEQGRAYDALLTEAKSEQQSQQDDLLCVNVKTQVVFGHLPSEMNQICQAAYVLAQELASSAAAQAVEELATTDTALDSPVYQEAFQSLDLEIERLSRSPTAVNVLTTSGNSADELGFKRLDDYITHMYRGIYIQVEEYAPGNRKWCVD